MDNLYIKDTNAKGRGIFANNDFKNGEIVDASPVIIFSYKNLTTTLDKQYMFEDGERVLVKKITEQKQIPEEINNIIFNWSSETYNNGESCIALGYGSLFNGANPSNLRYSIDLQNTKLLFIAVRDIKKDEELTVNYSGVYGSHISEGNWWFEKRGIFFIE